MDNVCSHSREVACLGNRFIQLILVMECRKLARSERLLI